MKKVFARLHLSPGFLLFMILFSYLESIRARIAPGQLINGYTFTPEAVITAIPQVLIIVLLLRYCFQKIHGDSFPFHRQKAVASFLAGMIGWVLASNLISLMISLVFGTFGRNFVYGIILRANFANVLDFMVYGGFYFAFLLFQKFQENQRMLAAYDAALAESTIRQLKQQLNPHFLFNNLNVLDQLIEENPATASEFLHDFSEIYRYALEKSDVKLVRFEEELDFATNYFRLLSRKFGKGFKLNVSNSINTTFLPPLTLQLLIENAVFHNQGNEVQPITISIDVQDKLRVTNKRKPYKFKKQSGGRGLENLRKQYGLLSEAPIQIIETNEIFTVELPLIDRKA
ncbi:sensor histidine kinase [Algoriphagus sp. Y33]|uniref:sensor histidine kinase n=1 Tax=Algoriphagus sp. Y33 TaxID=2772483 RepID=UPI00177F92D3|nr:histidine kinase [Algoriphagus sp. Y33]